MIVADLAERLFQEVPFWMVSLHNCLALAGELYIYIVCKFKYLYMIVYSMHFCTYMQCCRYVDLHSWIHRFVHTYIHLCRSCIFTSSVPSHR